MTVDDKIKDEKLPYNINREATKIALLSGKIHKYDYLTGEEIIPSDQSRSLYIVLLIKLSLYTS